jgi:hypothetical protein
MHVCVINNVFWRKGEHWLLKGRGRMVLWTDPDVEVGLALPPPRTRPSVFLQGLNSPNPADGPEQDLPTHTCCPQPRNTWVLTCQGRPELLLPDVLVTQVITYSLRI